MLCVCFCYLSNHLVLVGVDEARQAAGQRRSNQLTHTHRDQYGAAEIRLALANASGPWFGGFLKYCFPTYFQPLC